MNLHWRSFLFRDDGTILALTGPQFFDVYTGKEALKEFAGKSVRWLYLTVELEDKKPPRISRYEATRMVFDDRGFMRKEKDREYRSLLLDAGILSPGKQPPPPRTAQEREAQERLKLEWTWEFTPADWAAVRKLLRPKGNGK